MYYIVNDVETSGRHKWWYDVVSCGLVVLDQDLNIIDKFYEVCCPWYPKNFDHDTVAFHKLPLAFLLKQQSSYQMCLNILHFLNRYRDQLQITYRPFIYHAANRFDFVFMENMFLKNELEFSFRKMFNGQHAFSTLKMAREMSYTENSLDKWADRLGERLDHHNALHDAVLCAKAFKYLIGKGATMESGFEIKKEDKEKIDQPITEIEETVMGIPMDLVF